MRAALPTGALPTGPTGLGTSAARITAGKTAGGASDGPGTGVPELYCPPALRDDPALGGEVNDRLVEWAARSASTPDGSTASGPPTSGA
ncbi:hypothetical protein ACFQ2B_02445 [Streptomyces stramineus]